MPSSTSQPELHERPAIAIVGLGPRGASLVERLGAHLAAADAAASETADQHPAPTPELDLILIDAHRPGAGRIWRTDQTRELCMNTLADAVTLFTEPGATVAGPVAEGPTLYEWCIIAREGTAGPVSSQIPPARLAPTLAYPPRAGLATEYADELAALRPESHPSRALYGEYLEWFFDRAIAELPASVRVTRVAGRATSIERVDGRERIEVTGAGETPSGSVPSGSVSADAVILSTGWLDRAHAPAEAAIASAIADRPELTWVPQGSPVEQDLSGIAPGQDVIVRGLGMGFFDTMALLTAGRGGRFVPDERALGGLRYEASGNEPVLHVTSHRGVPFRAKSRYGGLPPRAAQSLLLGADWANEPRPINFDRALWPRIVADAFIAHAETLHRVQPTAFVGDPDAALEGLRRAAEGAIRPIIDGAAPTNPAPTNPAPTNPADLDATVAAVTEAAAPFIANTADRFDLAGEIRPAAGHFASPAEFDAWITQRVARDLTEGDLGIDSALKAGLWSISSARGVAQQIDSFGGFDAESRANGGALLTSLGGMVGSGPPAFRNNQLLALAAAGLVHFIGPAASITVDERGFVASSPSVTGSEVAAHALIDAWMHFHDVRASADPLSLSLIAAGRARPFSISARGGSAHNETAVPTAGFDVDSATGLLVGAGGALDPAVHIAGIPVEDTLRGTVISPLPGTDAPMLRETDRVALSALRIARSALTVAHAA